MLLPVICNVITLTWLKPVIPVMLQQTLYYLTEIWMIVTGRAQCMLLYILWEPAIEKKTMNEHTKLHWLATESTKPLIKA